MIEAPLRGGEECDMTTGHEAQLEQTDELDAATRREVMAMLAGAGLVAGATGPALAAESASPAASGNHPMAKYRLMAKGLLAPEGPSAMADGSVLVGEMARGTVSRVMPDGKVTVVAKVLGSPNGTALGPDGMVIAVNSGGGVYHRQGDELIGAGPGAGGKPGGAVERVDLKTGSFTTLYSMVDGIHGGNDIAFDRWGSFWFTDPSRATVWWANTEGTGIFPVATVLSANGIAFAPDYKTLYVVSSMKGQVVALDVRGPGDVARDANGKPIVRVVANFPKLRFDSMGVEADGTLVVGTLFSGCLTLITPEGKMRDQMFLPGSFVTNVSFGGPGMKTAYVTLTRKGMLVAVDWPRPGMKLVNY